MAHAKTADRFRADAAVPQTEAREARARRRGAALRTTRRSSRLWLHYRRGARSDGRGNRARLYFKGTVATEAQKNELWNAIKTIPTWQKDIVADIQVTGEAKTTAAAPAGAPKIFELNRDRLTDPDKIRPGQVLRLP